MPMPIFGHALVYFAYKPAHHVQDTTCPVVVVRAPNSSVNGISQNLAKKSIFVSRFALIIAATSKMYHSVFTGAFNALALLLV